MQQAIWLPKRLPLRTSSLHSDIPVCVSTSRVAYEQALLGRSSLALTLSSRLLQDQDHGFQERCLQSQLAGLIGIYPQRVISHFQGARVSFPTAKMYQRDGCKSHSKKKSLPERWFRLPFGHRVSWF